MKKFFLYLSLLILVIIGSVYSVLFTGWGNGVVSGIISDKINEEKVIVFTFDKFLVSTNKIDIVANIDSNSKINISGDYSLFGASADIKYDINIKDLAKLQKITGKKLKGSFSLSGIAVGNKELMNVQGKTNIFSSKTTYDIKMINFEPSFIQVQVLKARIQDALVMLEEPAYAKGYLDINMDIKNAQIGTLDGLITTKVYQGLVNNPVVNKAFDLKLVDKLTFKTTIITKLKNDLALSSLKTYTSKANIFVKEAKVNLRTQKINSDYKIVVGDLRKLFDVSGTKMRGAITIDGNFIKDENILVDGKSKLLKGTLNYKLLNDDFTASIKNIDLLKGLYMMYYPEVFNSSANIDVVYNLKDQKGLMTAILKDGQLVKSDYSSQINALTRFDLTKEVYEETTLESKINKNIINSIMHLKSKHTTLDMTQSVLDTLKNTTDSTIKVNIKGLKFDTIIKGNLNDPSIKIKLDAKAALKSKIDEKKKVYKEKLENKLKDKLKSLF